MFTLQPQGPYSLRETAMFGFGQRHDTVFDGTLRMAFCCDGSFEPAGVAITQSPDGTVRVDGDERTRDQVARLLGVDVDGTGFADVGLRDPVMARLQAAAPGLRPPQFHSPYEAAAWCVLSARRPVRQMQAVRARLSAQHGQTISLAGQDISAFPAPAVLRSVDEIPGLDQVKVDRLRALAEAALDGLLDTDALRALDPEAARKQLERLPGIGPFSSQLVVVRALGHTDVLPTEEPRALAVVGELYGLAGPASQADLERIATDWVPFRTWALVLARAASSRLTPPSAGAASSR